MFCNAALLIYSAFANHSSVRKHFIHLCYVCAVFALTLPGSAQDYSIIKLPTLGGKATRAFAINDSGQVVGRSDVVGNTVSHAFLWTKSGGLQDLGVLGEWLSVAYDINSKGHVVGSTTYLGGSGTNHAFLWTHDQGMQDLGTLGGLYSAASALNDSDTIVGYSDPTPLATAPHAFLWNQIGGMRDLGTLGGCGSVASGINRGGQVVGFSYIAPCSVLHAFLWTEAGGMQDLGTLGGPESLATAINDNGVVVGLSNTADGLTHAFRWTQSAKMQDLGTFPGGNWSVANAIHKSKVVGSASGENIKSAPFIWTAATGMKMVGPFGNLRIDGADGINSLGQLIVSTYGRWGYSSRLLTPLSPTSVSLVSSLNPSTSGQWVKITAAVSGTGPFAPTGTVAFRNGTTGIGSGTLIGGVAKILKNNLPTGTLSITATYSGDMWSKKSTSPVLIQVVNPAP